MANGDGKHLFWNVWSLKFQFNKNYYVQVSNQIYKKKIK